MLREFLAGGVTYPWTLVASVALGVPADGTPLVFGTEPPLYFSDHVAGCLVILVAVTAMAESCGRCASSTSALGPGVAASPILLAGGSDGGTVVGVADRARADRPQPAARRPQRGAYGGWDRVIV